MSAGRERQAFTLVELLVVLAIIGLLAALLLPSLNRAKEKAKGVNCLGNLRQWNLALSLYLAQNNDFIPRRGQGVQPLHDLDRPQDWFNCLPPLIGLPAYSLLVTNRTIPKPGETSVYVCPTARATTNEYFLAYAMNFYLSPTIRPQQHRLAEIPNPSSIAFMADGGCAYSSTVPSRMAYSVQARHAQRANVTFIDGHAQSFAGKYLGCGAGAIEREDIRWQTGTDGINHAVIP